MATDPENNDFLFFSREYSQAVEAFEAISKQASTLVALGSSDQLDHFIDQFLTMARTTGAEAEARDLTNIAEWFGELVRKAHGLREMLHAGDA